MSAGEPFSVEQQQYLAGFAVGSGLAGSVQALAARMPGGGAIAALPAQGATDPHRAAQDRTLAGGGRLSPEEQAKRDKNGLDLWDTLIEHARSDRFPRGTDVFLFKFQGLFYVAPAQDSFMCRLRIPGGILRADQLEGIADLAQQYAQPHADLTTRANLQLREIKPRDTIHLLQGLADRGLIIRGCGADNVRNITADPTAGFDPAELIDVRPLVGALHHHLLNHRELFGLPRKFNIAFDGGGAIAVLAETNDIGFSAVRVDPADATSDVPAGVHFRLAMGGITGHQDFARGTGVLVEPDRCVEVCHAILLAFIEHGDRTDRRKARLKYVLDRLGLDRFMAEVATHLRRPLPSFPLERCRFPQPRTPRAHVGWHRQRQDRRWYAGVTVPAARLRDDQMRGLAEIARRFGRGEVRLTVWQNMLIPHVDENNIDAVNEALSALEMSASSHALVGGLVACTGAAGCRYAATHTKLHALRLAQDLGGDARFDEPINIHLTGCHHSCAQHYIGDIGLLGTRINPPHADPDAAPIEGYRLFLGGGFDADPSIGRQVIAELPADRLSQVVANLIHAYRAHRVGDESFSRFTRRQTVEFLTRCAMADDRAAREVDG